MARLLAFGIPAALLMGCQRRPEPQYFSLASQVLLQPCGTSCRGVWTQAFDAATGNSLTINRARCERPYPDPQVCNSYTLWSRTEGKRYFWTGGCHYPPDDATDDSDDTDTCCYSTPSPAPIQLPPGYGIAFTTKVDRCELPACVPIQDGDPLACEQALALAARRNPQGLGRRGVKSASVNCTTVYHVPPYTTAICSVDNCSTYEVPESWVQEEWNKSVEVSPAGLLLSVTVQRTSANASDVKICDSEYPSCTMSLGTGVTTEAYNSTRHVPADGYCELGTWWKASCKERCSGPQRVQMESMLRNAPTQPSDAMSFMRSERVAV